MNSSTRPEMDPAQRRQAFADLVNQDERVLYRYLRTFVRNRADAEELMQESLLVAWRKFGDFEEGTNFRAWLLQIAFFAARNHRRSRYNTSVETADAVARAIADERETDADRLDERAWALNQCRQRLGPREKDLLRRRYELEHSVKQIGEEVQRSEMAVYKALSRIHHNLLECIERTLRREGS